MFAFNFYVQLQVGTTNRATFSRLPGPSLYSYELCLRESYTE